MDSNYIKKLVCSLGADVCGISDMKRFENAPKGFHPLDIYPEGKSVISFGKHFSSSPQSALDGVTVNQKKCREICGTKTAGGGFVYSCNICRKVCPFSNI